MVLHKKLGSWLLSPAGKTFASCAAVVIGTGMVGIQIAPHIFFLDNYRKNVQLQKNGLALPVPQEVGDRFQKTMDLLEISEKDKKQFNPFMVRGFDIFSAGTYFSHSGVIVGLPVNFSYADPNTINKSDIEIGKHSVRWESNEAKLLLKSLVLSESAQMYVIAREIEMRRSLKCCFDLLNSVLLFASGYGAAKRFNTIYDLYARSRLVRLTLYALLGAYCLLVYSFLKDVIQLYFEEEVDAYLKKKHPLFKEGGEEFYTSVLNRNVALRSLLGSVGENKYTAVGEENYFLRQEHAPLLERRDFFAT